MPEYETMQNIFPDPAHALIPHFTVMPSGLVQVISPRFQAKDRTKYTLTSKSLNLLTVLEAILPGKLWSVGFQILVLCAIRKLLAIWTICIKGKVLLPFSTDMQHGSRTPTSSLHRCCWVWSCLCADVPGHLVLRRFQMQRGSCTLTSRTAQAAQQGQLAMRS